MLKGTWFIIRKKMDHLSIFKINAFQLNCSSFSNSQDQLFDKKDVITKFGSQYIT